MNMNLIFSNTSLHLPEVELSPVSLSMTHLQSYTTVSLVLSLYSTRSDYEVVRPSLSDRSQ